MLSNIEEIIKDLKNGKMIIIVDDEDRENEGDLAFAADKVTPEMINFMSIYGKGLICVPMLGSRLDSHSDSCISFCAWRLISLC